MSCNYGDFGEHGNNDCDHGYYGEHAKHGIHTIVNMAIMVNIMNMSIILL